MFKKGQAAMEFLMTYGWAILAAIIAIGVLAYFGVFSPGRLVSDTYTANAPFNIRAGTTNTTHVTIDLLNNAGDTLNITSIAMTNCNSSGQVIGQNHPTGNITIYAIGCNPVLTSGSQFRGDITISYKKSSSSLVQQSTGSVISRVR